jgi:hypothetical protein
MHTAAEVAAQQQAMKRPRMQMQQQPLLQAQGLSAGLMQQQLAAAVAAASGAPSAAALQPLQQLQALAGLTLSGPTALTSVSAPLGMHHAAGPAALTPAGSTAAALPQLPTRWVGACLITRGTGGWCFEGGACWRSFLETACTLRVPLTMVDQAQKG